MLPRSHRVSTDARQRSGHWAPGPPALTPRCRPAVASVRTQPACALPERPDPGGAKGTQVTAQLPTQPPPDDTAASPHPSVDMGEIQRVMEHYADRGWTD